MNNTATMIESLRAQFEKDQANVRLDFEKKLAEIHENAKKSVRVALEKAQYEFNNLDKDTQAAIVASDDIKEIFASFGFVKRKAGKASGKGKTRALKSLLTKEDVLNFITTGEKLVGEINEHFKDKASKVTVGNRIKELLDAGKIEERKAGTKKYLKVA